MADSAPTSETVATNAPSGIGSLVASRGVLELQKFLSREWNHVLVARELYIDARHHRHYVSRLIRNPDCRDHGVKLRKFNDDIYDSFGEAAEAVFETVRAHSPLADKIHRSFLASRKDLGAWSKISDQAFVAQRNRVLGL